MKIKIPDVPRDEQDTLCWKQERNAYGNIATFVRCTKPKGHDAPGSIDPRHSWDFTVDAHNISSLT